MRLIFHGKLREMYGESAVMAADTVADALEGYSRQQPDWPRDLRVAVVGFDTIDKLFTETDEQEIHLMPSFSGGGGKFGSIILSAVLIVAGLIIGGPWLIPLVVSGGLMILQGVINLFMKAPSMNTTADPDASKYLGISVNTTKIGTPITMAWGRIDLSGQWLSLQSDSNNLSYGTFPNNPT